MIKQPQICVSENGEKWIQLQYGNLVWGKYRDRVINHQIVGKARFSDKAGECTSLDDLEVPPMDWTPPFWVWNRPLVGANHLTYKILVSSRIIGWGKLVSSCNHEIVEKKHVFQILTNMAGWVAFSCVFNWKHIVLIFTIVQTDSAKHPSRSFKRFGQRQPYLFQSMPWILNDEPLQN